MTGAPTSDPWPKLRSVPVGTRITVTDSAGHRWSGTLLPSHELSGDRILTLKVESGYNVGVRIDPDSVVEVGNSPPARSSPPAIAPPASAHDGEVVLLTTGGTIASRIDYETGGVAPVKDEREILTFYPELASSGEVRIVPVMDRLSENLVPADWILLAENVAAAFRARAKGVVIAHGTDTLGFTAAALSFLLTDLPGPVVLVGAQRSPDRPSSDGPSNLAAAVELARNGDLAEVVAVMHDSSSDDRFAVHRGTWVRKMHSSRRDAFRSRNGAPLGWIDASGVHLTGTVRRRRPGVPIVDGPLDARAGLLWSYPGLEPGRAARYADGLRGVVLAGTGLGHVSVEHLAWIREAVGRGVVVAMTTQCLEGTVDPYVYATGRELLRAGVVFLDDLLPETAYAKLCWALGRSDTPARTRALLLENRAGEFLDRRKTGVLP